jgi:hypothetical protein
MFADALLQGRPTIWQYQSADAVSTVAGAGYITNAYDLGMQVNDVVIVIDTGTPLVSTCRVSSVSSTTNLANLSAGVTIGNT